LKLALCVQAYVDCVVASAKKDNRGKSRSVGGAPNRTTDGPLPSASALASGPLPDGATSDDAPVALLDTGAVDGGTADAISGLVRLAP
jgi:hypothetical protein